METNFKDETEKLLREIASRLYGIQLTLHLIDQVPKKKQSKIVDMTNRKIVNIAEKIEEFQNKHL